MTPHPQLRRGARRGALLPFAAACASLLLGCDGSGTSGPPADTTPPSVAAVTPPDGAVDVALASTVSATFSEAVNASTLSTSTFLVTGGSGAVAGSVALSGSTATFTPAAPLAEGVTYTARVTPAVRDMAGNALAAERTWSFTTLQPALAVVGSSPTPNAANVRIEAVVRVDFSAPVAPASVTSATFVVRDAIGLAVPGSFEVEGSRVTFRPAQPLLERQAAYTVTLTTGIRGVTARALAAQAAFSFTTVLLDPDYTYRFYNESLGAQTFLAADDRECSMAGADRPETYWGVAPLTETAGHYRITNGVSGPGYGLEGADGQRRCLLAAFLPGGQTYTGQRWKLTPVAEAPTWFRMQNAFLGDGRSLDTPMVEGRPYPVMAATGVHGGQRWRFVRGPEVGAPGGVASVTVSAPATSLVAGSTLQATATARDASGNLVTNLPVTWASSDPATAGVLGSGLVSAELPGQVSITATVGGTAGALSLTVRAPALTQLGTGLTGHLGVGMSNAGLLASHAWGFSYYSMIHPLQPAITRDTQLGWGTWVMPENLSFTQPLCPPGTFARDHWPERGPTYRDVYQTLEGGAGLWTTTRFPAPLPKFRINSTPDCYTYQVASTGWQFWGEPLPASKLGLVQLSNRLLTVPDGVVFTASEPSLLGYGWLALPLIPSSTSRLGVPTGDQSWTLFLSTQNFRGPVAFFAPEAWSAVNATDVTAVGRGLDARPGFTGSVALEVGITPAFESQDRSGVRYRRVPRLAFASDGAGRATLLQDVRYYSRAAIWDATAAWLQGGAPVTRLDPSGVAAVPMADAFVGLSMDGSPVATDPAQFTSASFATAGGGQAMGMRWGGGMPAGVLPEFYRREGGVWRAVPASQVPRETFLADQLFEPLERGSYPELDVSGSGPWNASRWRAGPFTTTLGDGSVVDYVWYRFVEQPAIARLGLDAATLQRLQAFAESLHERSGLDGVTIPPPSSGQLVSIDSGQLVTPPAGLEKGYVPIVIRQR